MSLLLNSSYYIHIVFGTLGFAAFWVAAVTSEGSPVHVRFGKIFSISAYIVSYTAIFNSLYWVAEAAFEGMALAPNAELYGSRLFLAHCGIVTIAFARQARRAVETKREPAALRTVPHIALQILALAGSFAGIAYAFIFPSPTSPLLLALSPVGMIAGGSSLTYMFGRRKERMGYLYQHIRGMMGAGIAFHSSFFVHGAKRIFSFDIVFSEASWIPWVLPAAIGVPTLIYWELERRGRYGDLRFWEAWLRDRIWGAEIAPRAAEAAREN